jgi:hypothetical protein
VTDTQTRTTPATSRGTAALRWTTTVLLIAADSVNALPVLAAIAAFITVTFNVGPDWAQGTPAIVAVLAVYGVSQLAEELLGDVAAWIDPDARDGQELREAGRIVNSVWADLNTGADRDDVLVNLHISALPEQVAGLLEDLSKDADDNTTAALWTAADGLRSAARTIAPQP